MKKNNRGMTVIEVLLVTTIIGLLLLMSYLVYTTQIAKARDAKRKSDIYELRSAAESFEKDHECYPTFIPACGTETDWPYLENIPCQPEAKVGYFYYAEPDLQGCPRWYWIFTNLQNTKDPIIEELGCINGCGIDAESLFYNYYQTSPNAPEPAKGTSPRLPGGSDCILGKAWGCFSGECRESCIYSDGTYQCGTNYSTSNCGGAPCEGKNGTCCQDEFGNPINECTDGQ